MTGTAGSSKVDLLVAERKSTNQFLPGGIYECHYVTVPFVAIPMTISSPDFDCGVFGSY